MYLSGYISDEEYEESETNQYKFPALGFYKMEDISHVHLTRFTEELALAGFPLPQFKNITMR